MNKNLISKLFTNRFFLIFLSSFIGMMLVNFLILFSLPFAKQKYNYPRNLLRYLPPLARWDYPDFEKSDSNINALIIGDSYAEGAGDSFLNNEYKYSIGHYLSEYTNFNYKLAANGGSDLLFQISFLEDSFRNNHSSLKNFKE